MKNKQYPQLLYEIALLFKYPHYNIEGKLYAYYNHAYIAEYTQNEYGIVRITHTYYYVQDCNGSMEWDYLGRTKD